VLAALLAHALDANGLLPFVHETGDVRGAMGPLAVALWLALTAVAVGLAASSRRPALCGAPASLASAGLPELIGRHDIGALFEPSAMLGALLQWLLLLVVVALAVVASHVLRLAPLVAHRPAAGNPAPAPGSVRPYVAPGWRLRSRAPPARSFPPTISFVQEGHPCMHHPYAASPL
jgi:hypothetical protein